MNPTILLYIGSALAGACSLYCILYIYLPDKVELQAKVEILAGIGKQMDQGLLNMAQLRVKGLPTIKESTSAEIDRCIEATLGTAHTKIDNLMNNDFYRKAALAALPFSKWKREFEQTLKDLEADIIDQRRLGRELQAITKDAENELRERLLTIFSAIQIEETNLSAKTRKTLNKLKDRPERVINLLGSKNLLSELVHIDPRRDAAIGFGFIGAGYAAKIAAHQLDISAIAALNGEVMKELFGSELLKHATVFITHWLVDLIGEQGVAELTSILADLLPIVGWGFLAFRLYRYGRIYYRLFIAKEPLANMIKSVKASVNESLYNVGDTVEESMVNQMNDWIADIERQLRKTKKEIDKQQTLAKILIKLAILFPRTSADFA